MHKYAESMLPEHPKKQSYFFIFSKFLYRIKQILPLMPYAIVPIRRRLFIILNSTIAHSIFIEVQRFIIIFVHCAVTTYSISSLHHKVYLSIISIKRLHVVTYHVKNTIPFESPIAVNYRAQRLILIS